MSCPGEGIRGAYEGFAVRVGYGYGDGDGDGDCGILEMREIGRGGLRRGESNVSYPVFRVLSNLRRSCFDVFCFCICLLKEKEV